MPGEAQAGSAFIQINPSLKGFHKQIAQQLAKEMRDIEVPVQPVFKEPKGDPFEPIKRRAPKEGEKAAGAFGSAFQKRLRAAMAALPEIEIDAQSDDAERAVDEVRKKLLALSDKQVGVDLNADDAQFQLEELQRELEEIDLTDARADVQVNVAKAKAQLEGFKQDIEKLTGETVEVDVEVDVDTTEAEAEVGAFARAARAQIESALAALPEINIDANTTQAELELNQLRQQLLSLRDARIGVDLSSEQARQALHEIRAELARIGQETVRPDIKVNAGTALAELSAFEAKLQEIDGQRVRPDVDTSGMNAGLGESGRLTSNLIGLGIALAPALVPALAAAAGAAVGLANALLAAGAGAGTLALVAAPAIANVSKALQAQEAAEKQAAGTAATSAMQRIQAAYAARQAAQAVADAERNVARVAEDGARRIKEAQQGVQRAREQAAESIRAANQRVADSERDLAEAQADVRRAQEDLTRAREDALRALDDMRERTRDLALDEEGAQIALLEAQQRLAAIQKDPKSSDLDKRKAALDLAEAQNRLADIQRDRAQSAKDLAAAEKAGVDGSEQVLSAQERIRQAEQGVTDARRANAEAERELAKTELEAARSITEAQAKVAQARSEAARSEADARRALTRALEAQAHQAETASAQADAGAASQRNLAYAMAQLTPMQKRLMDGWIHLRDSFKGWAASLEPAVIPLFLKGMRLIEQLLPSLSPIVKSAAGGFGILLDQLATAMKSPFWQSFFDMLARMAGPSIVSLGTSFGNIAKAVASLIMAFEPLSGDILKGIETFTARFADWAGGLSGSGGFQRFIDYIRETGPKLIDTIGSLGRAFGNILRALAPLGPPILAGIKLLADIIASIPPDVLGNIAVRILTIVGVVKAWSIAQAVLNAVMAANPIGLIVVAIAALVAGFIHAYKTSETFRNIVDKALRAIGDAAKWVWETILKPAFTWLVDFWNNVLGPAIQNLWRNQLQPAFLAIGQAAMWLWQNVLKPAFEGMQVAIDIWWNYWVKPIFNALKFYIMEIVIPVIMFLWKNVIVPVFNAIAKVVQLWWNYWVKPIFNALKWYITKVVVPVFLWLWKNIIVPVFQGIASVISWWWRNIVTPVFNAVKSAISTLGGVFNWLWRNIIVPAWNGISNTIKTVWEKFIRPAFDNFKRGVQLIVDAFQKAKDDIGKAWDLIKSKTKAPIKWVIDTIYNKGVVRLWNRLADAVGLDSKKLKEWRPKEFFARGGVVSGPPSKRDNRVIGARSGEAVMVPEFAAAVGGRAGVHALNRAAERGGLGTLLGSGMFAGGFREGGIVGDALGFVGNVAGTVGGAIKDAGAFAVDFLQDPAKVVKSYIGGEIGKLLKSMPPAGLFGDLTRSVPGQLVDMLAEAAKKFAGSINILPGDRGGPATGRAAKNQAIGRMMLSAFGFGLNQWPALKALWTGESGWNHLARNPSSGAYGIPQSLPASKMASAGSDWRTNPATQIKWGLGYIKGRYGSPAGAYGAWLRRSPHWYDQGGLLPPGLSIAMNGTRKPEAILTQSQFKALAGAAKAGLDSTGRTVNVYPQRADIDARELQRIDRMEQLRARVGRPR